jgi:hypothetical protein
LACVENIVLTDYGKIKNVQMKRAILDYLHAVMFMSINPRETIELLKTCGGGG